MSNKFKVLKELSTLRIGELEKEREELQDDNFYLKDLDRKAEGYLEFKSLTENLDKVEDTPIGVMVGLIKSLQERYDYIIENTEAYQYKGQYHTLDMAHGSKEVLDYLSAVVKGLE